MFEGARLKVERAEKHIADFNAAFQTFVDSNPYVLTVNGRYGTSYWGVELVKPLPSDLMLIVGDAVHNLRSALDHCVWDMSAPNRPLLTNQQKRYLVFEAAEHLTDYESMIDGVLGFSADVKSFLKSIAVHRYGSGHALLDLHRLDIDDKHAVIVPTISQVELSGLRTIKRLSTGENETREIDPTR